MKLYAGRECSFLVARLDNDSGAKLAQLCVLAKLPEARFSPRAKVAFVGRLGRRDLSAHFAVGITRSRNVGIKLAKLERRNLSVRQRGRAGVKHLTRGAWLSRQPVRRDEYAKGNVEI